MSSQSQGNSNRCRNINVMNNLTQEAAMKYMSETTVGMFPNKYILSKRVKVGSLSTESKKNSYIVLI
jgi:hypothetical protein